MRNIAVPTPVFPPGETTTEYVPPPRSVIVPTVQVPPVVEPMNEAVTVAPGVATPESSLLTCTNIVLDEDVVGVCIEFEVLITNPVECAIMALIMALCESDTAVVIAVWAEVIEDWMLLSKDMIKKSTFGCPIETAGITPFGA